MNKSGGIRTGLGGKTVNLNMFTLTYGAVVVQLLKDYEDREVVNKKLDTMGCNIGMRLAEDMFSRVKVPKCEDLRTSADVLCKTAFSMYLGVTPTTKDWSQDGKEFSLVLNDNPLDEFVELPETEKTLFYSNVLPGIIRGGLKAAQVCTETWFVSDRLLGQDETVIKVKFVSLLADEVPPGDE
eukprot:CFRG7242T1